MSWRACNPQSLWHSPGVIYVANQLDAHVEYAANVAEDTSDAGVVATPPHSAGEVFGKH